MMNLSHYSFLSLEIRFLEKSDFLNLIVFLLNEFSPPQGGEIKIFFKKRVAFFKKMNYHTQHLISIAYFIEEIS